MATPDHMSGIERAVPKFVYDPKNYDPKAYKEFKDARRAVDQERVARSQRELKRTMRNVAQEIKEHFESELRKAGITTEDTGRNALEWLGESTCFSDLTYDHEAEEVVATFRRDGSVYRYGLTREEAEEWFDAPSAGKFFNAEIR